jgi:hypothetical protein
VTSVLLLLVLAQDPALVQTIPLPKVEGRIDHLAYDPKSQQLAVAALGNNTVELIDLAAGRSSTRSPVLRNLRAALLEGRTGRRFRGRRLLPLFRRRDL